jgi:hypothetical protein
MATLTSNGRIADLNSSFGWTPAARPADGDTLQINSGIGVMFGGSMPDTTVALDRQFDTATATYQPPPQLILVGRDTLGTVDVTTVTPDPNGGVIDILGHSTIGLLDIAGPFPGGKATVNILPGSKLTTTITAEPRSQIHTFGGTLDNEGDSQVSLAVISSQVTGKGSWSDGFGHLEFASSVGSGQSVNLSGAAGMTIDQPFDFRALVNFEPGFVEDVLLEGIHGDGFTYDGSHLTIRSGGTVVDRLRLTEAPGVAFGVTDTANGIDIVRAFAPQQNSGAIAHVA